MMHLTGISSNAQSARHMTGLSANVSSKTKSNVFTMNSQNKGKGEDDAAARLQSQINTLRERVQSIAENDSLDAKTKGELTQSVREQMAELTQQLNQRRMEIRQQELEEEEERQSAGKTANSGEASENTGRAKYDSFTRDDSLGSVNHAMLSAAKSVKLSEIQHGAAVRKENQMGILEKQAEQDTKLVSKTVIAGVREKELVPTPKDGNAAEPNPDGNEIALTKSKDEAAANITETDVMGNILSEAADKASETAKAVASKSKKTVTVDIQKVWEVSRGASVEAKEEEIAKLRSDIHGIDKDQAKNLGEANRSLNGADAPEEDEAQGFADPALLRAEAHVVKGIYGNTVSKKVAAARLARAGDDGAFDAYA